jgi:hypothetical protein
MRYRFHKIVGPSVISVILIYGINISINFADQNHINSPIQQVRFSEKDSPSNEKDVMSETTNIDSMKCLHTAEKLAELLITIRNVIAKNQELINRDPVTGNYVFKDFVPAMVGSEVANDFSLKTGYRMKQTSLRVRNPNNQADEWEVKILKSFESEKYTKNVGYGEIIRKGSKQIYRYMKPIYVETACLQCHGEKDQIRVEIKQFLIRRYPFDNAFGYKEGELRGGISIVIPLTEE